MSKESPSSVARTGYPKLADFVGTDPHLAIFKKFGSLNAENLFYMQAEIAGLEQELQQIVADDLRSKDETSRKYATSWRVLQQAGKGSAQWQKRMEIREKLKEYSRSVEVLRIEVRMTGLQMPLYCNVFSSSEWTLSMTRIWKI